MAKSILFGGHFHRGGVSAVLGTGRRRCEPKLARTFTNLAERLAYV